jgi:hypothetical protein
MGQKIETGRVYLTTPIDICSLQLFKQRVVNPQVDVPAPVALLLRRRYVGNGTFVRLSNGVFVSVILGQSEQIKPGVVVVGISGHFLHPSTNHFTATILTLANRNTARKQFSRIVNRKRAKQPISTDLFIFEFALANDYVFNGGSVSVTFLVHAVRLVHLLTPVLGQVVQRVLVNDSRTFILHKQHANVKVKVRSQSLFYQHVLLFYFTIQLTSF